MTSLLARQLATGSTQGDRAQVAHRRSGAGTLSLRLGRKLLLAGLFLVVDVFLDCGPRRAAACCRSTRSRPVPPQQQSDLAGGEVQRRPLSELIEEQTGSWPS